MSRWNKPTRWVCAGCREAGTMVVHSESEPAFEGPMDEWGCNLYCEKSLGTVTVEQLRQALWSAVNKTDYLLIITPKTDSLKEFLADDEYGTWDACLDAGRSYLVGDKVPMKDFLKNHTSSITAAWMKLAVRLAMADNDVSIRVRNNRMDYKIYRRGEYVEIGLPHHDYGGERHWITRDCKRRVLVNVD